MLSQIFATKLSMTQAWTKQGRRMAVTRCRIGDNMVLGKQTVDRVDYHPNATKQPALNIFEIGYGQKKLKNMTKPLQKKIKRSGFSLGAKQIRGVRTASNQDETVLKVGDKVELADVLQVGDVVKVQGVSKGRGFAGVMKRHGFHGGPRTHGQSDRERAPGSIGAGTTPGRVWKGKKMPGHYGAVNKTVSGLVVLHIDPETKEIWLSGPVPGHYSSILRIEKTGKTKEVELDKKASGISASAETSADKKEEVKVEEQTEVKAEEAPVEDVKEEVKEEPKAEESKEEKKKVSKPEKETKKDKK